MSKNDTKLVYTSKKPNMPYVKLFKRTHDFLVRRTTTLDLQWKASH